MGKENYIKESPSESLAKIKESGSIEELLAAENRLLATTLMGIRMATQEGGEFSNNEAIKIMIDGGDDPSIVSEPNSLFLLGLGLLGIAGYKHKNT